MSINNYQNKFETFLKPLGIIYANIVRMHLNRQQRKAVKLPIPVISVGNISMGGSGKTPVCGFLADYLAEKGKKPVILTRGYKSSPKSLPHLVSIHDDPKVCGDEPLLLAGSLSGKAHVVVDPNRLRAAGWAMQNLNPGVFILDDGFQHVKLKRDRDLVLLTPHDLEKGWNRVFPWGSWREDNQALERADIFLINLWGMDIREVKLLVVKRPELRQHILYYLDVKVEKLINIDSGKPAGEIGKRPYILVTGVASPQKAVSAIRTFLGYGACIHLPFPDHHGFGPESIKAIIAMAKKAGVHDVICTSKDAVKIRPIPDLQVWETATTVRILDNKENMVKMDVILGTLVKYYE